MSAIVYLIFDNQKEHFYFATLDAAETFARNESAKPCYETSTVERLSVPHVTSEVLVKLLEGREWWDARHAVSHFRHGEKVEAE